MHSPEPYLELKIPSWSGQAHSLLVQPKIPPIKKCRNLNEQKNSERWMEVNSPTGSTHSTDEKAETEITRLNLNIDKMGKQKELEFADITEAISQGVLNTSIAEFVRDESAIQLSSRRSWYAGFNTCMPPT
jgi:hypothetical protein